MHQIVSQALQVNEAHHLGLRDLDCLALTLDGHGRLVVELVDVGVAARRDLGGA
jgi:hypothetical protein